MTDTLTVLAESALAGELISGTPERVDEVIGRIHEISEAAGKDSPPMWRYRTADSTDDELTLEVRR